MATAIGLLTIAAFVAGLMVSREHLAELASKFEESIDIFVEAMKDLVWAICAAVLSGLLYVVEMLCRAHMYLEMGLYRVLFWLIDAGKAILRFVRKWWWVPIVMVAGYLLMWGAISLTQGMISGVSAFVGQTDLSLPTFLAFMAAAVLVFVLAYTLMRLAQAIIWLLLAIALAIVLLMAFGVIALGVYGMAMLLGGLAGLLLAALLNFASVMMQALAAALSAMAFLLALIVPSCGQGDGGLQPPPAKSVVKPEPVAEAKAVPPAPFTIIGMAIAKPGDGCFKLLDRLGVAEVDAKLLLGTDRLSWCVAKAHEVSRVVYWHSDSTRWMAPKVCLNELPGRATQPETWQLVIWPDGHTEVLVPPDSRLCTRP